jgi:type II secretory pathway component PulJ
MGAGDAQRLVTALITSAVLAGMAWAEMPQWQREAFKGAVRAKTYRLLHRVARAMGRRGMGDELAGRRPEAEAVYGLTYRLSRLRDRV